MRGPIRPQGSSLEAKKSQSRSKLLPLRLITFNVRYATATPTAHEEPWSVRGPKLCNQLRFATTGHDAAFVCVQEALSQQAWDIREQLSQDGTDGDDGSQWAFIGRGRDDGKNAGEFSPIFYRPSVWRCERSHMYWLSKTPEKPSCGWDAVLNRVVTVGQFRHFETGAIVVVMSTHFDHIGVKARQESAKLILAIAKAWQHDAAIGGAGSGQTGTTGAQSDPIPVLLGGDFNSQPDDGAYKTITDSPGGMTDISGLVPSEKRYGNDEITYTSFDEPNETPKRIDFLFTNTTEGGIRFRTFGVLSNRFDDGVFLSDHRAVVADVDVPIPASE